MEENKSSLSFKIFFQLDSENKENIRRFRLDYRPTYDQFTQFLHKLYSPLYHPGLVLQYVDSENDKIFVTSQIEWEEMLAIVKENIIKLYVVKESAQQKKQKKQEQQQQESESSRCSTTTTNTTTNTTTTKSTLPFKTRLEERVMDCLKQLFPGNHVLPTNIPSFLTSAVRVLNVCGCDADIDIDIGKLTDTLFSYGYNLLDQKQYHKARDIYYALLTLNPQHTLATYNMACTESLLGNVTAALDYLETAVVLGYHNVNHLLTDSDLDLIKNNPRFLQILNLLQQQPQSQQQVQNNQQIDKTPERPPVAQSVPVPAPALAPATAITPTPIQPTPQLTPTSTLVTEFLPTPIQPTPQLTPTSTLVPEHLPTPIQPTPQLTPTSTLVPEPLPTPIQPTPQLTPTSTLVPESLPVPSRPIYVETPLKWATQLSLLHDIGFYEDDLSITLLEDTNGDVQQTVLHLLNI